MDIVSIKLEYDALQSLMQELEGKMFNLAVRIAVLESEVKPEDNSFNAKLKIARDKLRPIQKRGMGLTGIVPTPVDAKSVVDSEGEWNANM
jgi:hypothetical protein